MLKPLLLAGLAAAAFAPSIAGAQPQCPGQHNNRVLGTVLGAVGGAFLGNAIGEHGGKPGGTIIGGVAGGVVGNQIAGAGDHNCGANRYGYYDANGRWVPRTSTAYGYYDPNGRWVDTAGGGYASQGYAAPAYAPDYGRDAAYSDRDRWEGAPLDVRAREDWLDQGIRRRIADGSLDNSAGRRALRELSDIRRIDSDYRGYNGRLSYEQTADIQTRLDSLRASIAAQGPARSY